MATGGSNVRPSFRWRHPLLSKRMVLAGQNAVPGSADDQHLIITLSSRNQFATVIPDRTLTRGNLPARRACIVGRQRDHSVIRRVALKPLRVRRVFCVDFHYTRSINLSREIGGPPRRVQRNWNPHRSPVPSESREQGRRSACCRKRNTEARSHARIFLHR